MHHPSILASAALCFCALAPQGGMGMSNVHNFLITESGLSFEITGNLPATAPEDDSNVVFFVNADPAAEPGFSLGAFTLADSFTFTGSQTLLAVWTGNPFFGDYFGLTFEDDFAPGESISGLVSATWASNVFDPTGASDLNVYWGANYTLPLEPATQPSAITGGTHLDLIPIPEPASYPLALTLVVGIASLIRRRPRC